MSNLLASLANKVKYWDVINYVPKYYEEPQKLLKVESAWVGHDKIIQDLIRTFGLGTDKCLEFGVEFGYSTVALSNYFKQVKGVDIFIGDEHTSHKGDHYEETKARLREYANIELFKMDYKDWVWQDNSEYDLIHVDIIHTYQDTYDCGLWSAQHSSCAIFHDTESFPDVKRAVFDIARSTGKKFYNYPKYYGLGIVA